MGMKISFTMMSIVSPFRHCILAEEVSVGHVGGSDISMAEEGGIRD
jgi:hypothetical protein